MIECLGLRTARMKPAPPCIWLSFLVLLSMLTSGRLPAKELPLEYCVRLPAIQVEVVGKKPMLFLVDTAASSLLNLESFVLGESREVEIASYSGTVNTRAREVSLPETKIGSYKLGGLKMLAVEPSALGKKCGQGHGWTCGAARFDENGGDSYLKNP